jgi:hypothetical protein
VLGWARSFRSGRAGVEGSCVPVLHVGRHRLPEYSHSVSIWAWRHRETLEAELWSSLHIDAVHLAFFQTQFANLPGRVPGDEELAQHPDLDSPAQNDRRKKLLYDGFRRFLMHIPSSTTWYEVRYLRDGHLHQLRAIDFPEWNSHKDHNELLKVARRIPIALTDEPQHWPVPILWGHDRKGPFTVLEGIYRLTAYAALSSRPPLEIAAYVGLSADPCRWHLADR